MDLTLTVLASATGAIADVRVASPSTSPAALMLDALCLAVGAQPGEVLTIAGRPIAVDGTTADCGLVDGAVVTVGAAPPVAPSAQIELVVVSGPDAGRRVALGIGDHLVGRDPPGGVGIDDPAVSRRHLLLCVSTDTTTVTDLDSANGSTLDRLPLSADQPVPLVPVSSLRIGDSDLRVGPVAPPVTFPADGAIHRAPRLRRDAATVHVEFPPPATPPSPTRIPILAALAPLVAGVVLSVVLHQWQFLAFTALSPVMILGQAASDRLTARRTSRLAKREHSAATAAATLRLDAALADERLRRRRDAPDLAELTRAVANRTRLLWQRSATDPDAVVLRLGLGTLPSEVHVVAGPGDSVVDDVPVCAAMPQIGVLGVCGPRELRVGLARSLLIQAAVLHSPAQLRIVVLASGRASEWAWVRWLPHAAPTAAEPCAALVGFDDEQVATRLNELRAPPGRDGDRARTLVLVDATATTHESAAIAALIESATSGTSFIWCAATERELPGACRAVAQLSAASRVRLELTRDGQFDPIVVRPDLLAADVALAAARALAPLRDSAASASTSVPSAVRWEHVAEVDLSSHDAAIHSLTQHWSRGASTAVPLGVSSDGVLSIDLCRDGPHALIAGTTGSGKSELLLTLVAGLAVRNRPDELALLLIDHKGGAAFGPCARLPHTVGVVTDLDSESTRRALQSLAAEIRRREALFASAAAADLESYQRARRRGSQDLEPLARLVIVVDEFATLAEEQPEFVGALVGIAQRGRSLGVHLVLATQRPEGVVSADIRANTRLRICLGVARENESRDVIDSPAAATISRTTPGRAYLRVGPGELREFQTARIGGPRAEPHDLVLTYCPAPVAGAPPSPATGEITEDAGTDLDILIGAALELGTTLACVPPPPPWLPPLPELVELTGLPDQSDPGVASWGLLDLPAAGQQRCLELDLRTGATTLIAGAARSGRTTTVRAIALSAACRRSPDELVLWAIDSGAGLADLADLAHCGGILPAHEVDRIERLISYLTQEVVRRRQNPAEARPTLMLVIDSWEGLAAGGDHRDGGAVIDAVLRLAADGPAADLHTVITSDRGGLVGRLGGAASDKIVLRLGDPGDFALIGMPGRDVPRHLPPGRGIRAGDLALVQVASPDAAALAAAHRWPPPRRPVRRFDALPRRVSLAELAAGGDALTSLVTLGLGTEDDRPLRISRADLGRSFMIAGSPGSGRSTALTLIAQQLIAPHLAGRRLAVSCPPRSSLLDRVDAICLPRDDQDHAVALLDSLCSGGAAPDILIDDIDLLPEGPLWARVADLISNPTNPEQVVVMAGSIDTMSAAFRGPIAQARRAKVGLLLCPAGPHDGELFGIRLPRRPNSEDPPGRGWLARRGTATRVQLADPIDPPAALRPESGQPSTELELSRLGARSRE
jgi:S-DNA-T family DNA segregation ATPase FtsK/SpoIIIE